MRRIKSLIKKKLVKEVKNPVYIPVMQGALLESKTILITGGGSGIGKEIAKAAALNGAEIVICGRNTEKLNAAKESIGAQHKVHVCRIDLTEVDKFENIIESISSNCLSRKIDILVNNAGLAKGEDIGNTSQEDFMETLESNLKGTYFLSQAFSNYLIRNNICGNILNISSVSGVRPAISPYMISKWGINGLTKGLAKKLIKYNIVVNGIAPGPTCTQMLKLDGTNLNYDNYPAKRFVDPVEVANLAVFLMSSMGRMIVGEVINISGGCGTLTLDDINY